jgi:hypothetical protein
VPYFSCRHKKVPLKRGSRKNWVTPRTRRLACFAVAASRKLTKFLMSVHRTCHVLNLPLFCTRTSWLQWLVFLSTAWHTACSLAFRMQQMRWLGEDRLCRCCKNESAFGMSYHFTQQILYFAISIYDASWRAYLHPCRRQEGPGGYHRSTQKVASTKNAFSHIASVEAAGTTPHSNSLQGAQHVSGRDPLD